jgi:uncharacterized protein
MLRVCLDANIFISAIAFGGKPRIIVDKALAREFYLVTSAVIINETKRNLVIKLKVPEKKAESALDQILAVADIYEPTGQEKYIAHQKDSLVLETALLGRCDVLVTGDRKDLIPLKNFHGIAIELPAIFLERFPVN